ncbi:MAG: phage head morphogenesis protein [Lachnospiraceae bacterium]|nr:phage head morphogenesis protein [Lachnospiraceae bacterium]
MERQEKKLLLRRNKRYFSEIPFLSKDEVQFRAEIATLTEIELISLLNYMESELRKSADDFINNYGNFSDQLNRIYDVSDDAVFGENRSPFAARFSELQRTEWNKLLPVTLRRAVYDSNATDADILWLFAANRAEKTARNNTNSLCGCQHFEDLKRQGYKYKEWKTIMDGHERDTHAIANGQRVPIDEPFIVGGYKMMFPRDVTYGAPPKEIINCRCSIVGR